MPPLSYTIKTEGKKRKEKKNKTSLPQKEEKNIWS
jgi:hypothetical protein